VSPWTYTTGFWKPIDSLRSVVKKSLKPKEIVVALSPPGSSVFGSRVGASGFAPAKGEPLRSKPGSAWPMIMTAASPFAFALAKVSRSQAMSAAFRAAYSSSLNWANWTPGVFGSVSVGGVSPEPLEQRLLHVPGTFTVAYITPLNSQRRFSTQGTSLNVVAVRKPLQRGVD
jgi:hypothetical protein